MLSRLPGNVSCCDVDSCFRVAQKICLVENWPTHRRSLYVKTGLTVLNNLFINSDAILNHDALWFIQGKKHYLQAAIVGRIHHTGKILR